MILFYQSTRLHPIYHLQSQHEFYKVNIIEYQLYNFEPRLHNLTSSILLFIRNVNANLLFSVLNTNIKLETVPPFEKYILLPHPQKKTPRALDNHFIRRLFYTVRPPDFCALKSHNYRVKVLLMVAVHPRHGNQTLALIETMEKQL